MKIRLDGAINDLAVNFVDDFKSVMPANVDIDVMLKQTGGVFTNQVTLYMWRLYVRLYSTGRI